MEKRKVPQEVTFGRVSQGIFGRVRFGASCILGAGKENNANRGGVYISGIKVEKGRGTMLIRKYAIFCIPVAYDRVKRRPQKGASAGILKPLDLSSSTPRPREPRGRVSAYRGTPSAAGLGARKPAMRGTALGQRIRWQGSGGESLD